ATHSILTATATGRAIAIGNATLIFPNVALPPAPGQERKHMLSFGAGKIPVRSKDKNKATKGNRMKSLQAQLKGGGSTVALVTASFFASAAYAQPTENSVEAVTVTGTSIRGLAPVGSNLITVDQQQISDVGAVTISEVLANVPAITGMGNSGRGSN